MCEIEEYNKKILLYRNLNFELSNLDSGKTQKKIILTVSY